MGFLRLGLALGKWLYELEWREAVSKSGWRGVA